LVLVGFTENVKAEEPYAYLSVEQDEIELDTFLVCDTVIPEALTLKVTSNCLHGPITAKVSKLKRDQDHVIEPERIFIKTEATVDFISMEKPVLVSEPAVGSRDIVIDLKVKASGKVERAGRYAGTIAFTILPPVRR
jgi:hypothetical protein